MCNFFSAIVMKNGDLLYNEMTDSHEDLISIHKLSDNTSSKHRSWCRIEFLPKTTDDNTKYLYADIDSYTLYVDENFIPDWFEEIRENIERKCRHIVQKMIITGQHTTIIGRRVILHNADIRHVEHSTILHMENSKIGGISYSFIRTMDNSGICEANRTHIDVMLGNSQIDHISAGHIYDMRHTSQVHLATYGTIIRVMRNNSKVLRLQRTAIIEWMGDNSKIGLLNGMVREISIHGNCEIHEIDTNGIVLIAPSKVKVGTMLDTVRSENELFVNRDQLNRLKDLGWTPPKKTKKASKL